MSELDLGSSSTPGTPAASTGTATDLVLTPPAPVQVVHDEQAQGAIPVDEKTQSELSRKADAFAGELAALDVRSPEFAQKVGAITSMGNQDMRASANVTSRMLDRPAA